MKRIALHLLIPAAVPAIFFVIASIPVEVIGCRNRGLMAFAVALSGAQAGVISVILGLIRRMRGDASSSWFILSTIILALPAIFLVLSVR